ncbi:MAG: RidA family protein [Planctomycetes bacterium]|nr:RidA family protein [Planctomycetota bacterium]
MNITDRLAELNLTLPAAPKPVAAYLPAVRSGNLIFVSGQLPFRDGKLASTGAVSDIALAQAAAGQCVLNGLAVLGDMIGGDWSKFVRVVRVGVFVQSAAGFDQQAAVANGASELLQKIFGESGRHARAAVGVNALPLHATVEIEFIFEVRG